MWSNMSLPKTKRNLEIVKLHKPPHRMSYRQLAAKYKLDHSTIVKICQNEKLWKKHSMRKLLTVPR